MFLKLKLTAKCLHRIKLDQVPVFVSIPKVKSNIEALLFDVHKFWSRLFWLLFNDILVCNNPKNAFRFKMHSDFDIYIGISRLGKLHPTESQNK